MSLFTRREYLWSLGAVAAGAVSSRLSLVAATPVPGMRGPFMILNTPFTKSGAVDWDDLANEAAFVDRSGCAGMVWPQGSSGVATLTKDERLRGMEVLATTMAGKRSTLVLGVQGKDTADMLDYARRAESLNSGAMIAMPPTTGTSMDDYHAYFRALAGVTRRPVIIQTSGGAPKLPPTTELIVALAREFPHLAYVKEESEPLLERMTAELGSRPVMKGIYGASLGTGWLYEMRLGLDGIITGMGMYADLMAKMWAMHEAGRLDEVRDAYARFLLMRNLNEAIPGVDLFIMQKRGIFKTTVRRTSPPTPAGRAATTEFIPNAVERAEIEHRFAALAPYLSTP